MNFIKICLGKRQSVKNRHEKRQIMTFRFLEKFANLLAMLRRLLDFKLSFFEKGKPFAKFRPAVSAIDTFCYEPLILTKKSPYIRDAIDVKRWMMIVVYALVPTIIMALFNTGLQKMVYASGNYELMKDYLLASNSLPGFFKFVFSQDHFWTILKLGSLAFLPIVLISYLVGGLCEMISAVLRGHEISEGFLVTGMLYPLILPPTIPYWMAAIGIAFGVIVGKELFGGTGMNILNPALVSRAFLFFTFPGKMTGDVWVGTNPTKISQSIKQMNLSAGLNEIDGISQATPLGGLNAAIPEIKRIHVDAIATNALGKDVATYDVIEKAFTKWNETGSHEATLGSLDLSQMQSFVTSPMQEGGLGLGSSNFQAASQFVETSYGLGKYSDGNLFFGNILGSMGETSTLACLLGAFLLIYTGVGAWRTMVAFGLSAFITAFAFEFFSSHFGIDSGAWNPAKYAIPAYRHLLMGGLAFGLVFMATDPVSSPGMKLGKWIYGALIGLTTILIRLINPAFPEGVMLAILLGNVFAPLIDYYAVRKFRRRASGRQKQAA